MSESTGVPLLDLQAQYRPLRAEILAAIARVRGRQRCMMGPEITALEAEMAAMLGARHAVAVSSGTDALLLALMALDIRAGDEVITPTYSFFATAGAVARLGATPVLIDIEDATFNLDPAKLAAAITPKTKAIIPVHLFGQSAEMEEVLTIAAGRGIPVVEDAAQAIGASYRSQPLGGLGAFGCFSFFPSKNLGAFGDAGLVTTNDEALARKARLLRTHGMEPRYYHHLVGANFRMDALQAAILRVKAPHLAGWTERRRANADRYRTLFQDAGLLDRVTLPSAPEDRWHIYNQFVIRTSDRDGLKKHLDGLGIGTEIYYPVPFHQQPCFAYLGYREGAFPKAERAAQESLAIPIYSELTLAQQQKVVDAVAAFVHRRVAV